MTTLWIDFDGQLMLSIGKKTYYLPIIVDDDLEAQLHRARSDSNDISFADAAAVREDGNTPMRAVILQA